MAKIRMDVGQVTLYQRSGKPWHCEVYIGDLPLLDARGEVVTISKEETYLLAGGNQSHWVARLAAGGMRDITPP